jgi:pimeloyl-ACP methyl ester carboxylesterase
MFLRVTTRTLEIAYEEFGGNSSSSRSVVMVHGWPDDIHCWDRVIPRLTTKDCRVITPYLRGSGPTRFLSEHTMRSGQIAALADDLAQFMEYLDLKNVALVGHDWGARAAYAVGALFPDRISRLIAISAGYATDAPIEKMSYELSKAYWYEWFVATERGRRALDIDRDRICRYLWQSWSPNWRFSEDEFSATSASWHAPDWQPISVHAYLHRWHEAEGDPDLELLEKRLRANPPISIPTLVLHGEEDQDNFAETSAGKEPYFQGGYRRQTLANVGHFVPREAPELVANTVLKELDVKPSMSDLSSVATDLTY